MRISTLCGRSGRWLAALSLGGRLLLAADTPASLFDDPVVARGKGFEVHQTEVEDMVTGLRATLAATRDDTIPDAQRAAVTAQMLDRLVLTRMIQQRATAADKEKAKELAAKFITETKAKARSEDAFRRQLLAAGIKPEIFEQRALDQALVEVIIEREVKAKVTITDQQVKEFYEQGIDLQVRDIGEVVARLEKENKTNTVFYSDGLKRIADLKKANLEKLDRPEAVKAQVILFYIIDRITREELPDPDRKLRFDKAEQALKRVKAGEDFTKVAKEMSEDPEVERTGGEYVTVRDAVAYPELKTALFSQPIGEVSDVIATRGAYYIAKVLERMPAGKVPLDKVDKDVREALLGQEVAKRLPAFFEAMKKEFNVVYPLATNAPAAAAAPAPKAPAAK